MMAWVDVTIAHCNDTTPKLNIMDGAAMAAAQLYEVLSMASNMVLESII